MLKAKAGVLPIPAFQLGFSQQLLRMVNLSELASFIDKAYDDAKRE
jgi:hypothetical protein